jgi:hypothetical protein
LPLRSPEITPEPKRRNFSSVPTTPISGTADAPSSPSSSYLPKSLESAPPSPASLPRFTTAGFYVEDETHKAETDESVFHGTDGDESSFSAESEPSNYNPTGSTKGEKPTTYDPWGSFLTELSKVESQFFNPTVAKKPKSRSLVQSQPPAPAPLPPPDTVESDDEAPSPSPPSAPRTFYA